MLERKIRISASLTIEEFDIPSIVRRIEEMPPVDVAMLVECESVNNTTSTIATLKQLAGNIIAT